MKRLLAITVMLVCLFSVTIGLSELPVANGYTQTHELSPSGGGLFTLCELQPGDHIDASFQLSNIGPYTKTWPEQPDFIMSHNAYYNITIYLGFRNNTQKILTFPNTRGDSFSYTAIEGGKYYISHMSYGPSGLMDAKTPLITIDYEIIRAQTPAPNTPDPTSAPIIQLTPSSERQSGSSSPVYIFGFLVAIILTITISIVLLFGRRRKTNAKPPKGKLKIQTIT